MLTLKRIIFVSVLISALLHPTAAQDKPAVQGTSLTITAAVSGDRVRIAAPSSVVQMHLEVYAGSGEKLFDQEIRGGNVFDWHLQDGQGQRLARGTYVCVVTAKSVSGKLTQKIGAVNVAETSVSVQPATSQQLSAAQAQSIGPTEENSSWMIVGNNDGPPTGTMIANDGMDGQMIRGRGALTFRIGNFFSGVDTEQMRLTEAGDLGIGTSDPRAKLDVAGTIRAERFLVVKPKVTGGDKTVANTISADVVDPGQSLISGSGTQDRIAKWIDNAGTLGDSGITETGAGLVGIGTTTPDSKLVVSSNSAPLPPATSIARFAAADGVQTAVFADAFGTNPLFNVRRANGTAASPSAIQANQLLGVIGASGYGASTYSGTRARVGFFASENWTNTANGTYLTFNTTANGAATGGGTERVRIDSAGKVGIGTTAPTSILHVVGDTNLVGNLSVSGNGTAGGISIVGNSTVASNWQTGQLRISGATNPNMQLNLGYDTSSNVGVIQAGQANTAYTNLLLNPFGGNVRVGPTGPILEASKLEANAGDYQFGVMGSATNYAGVLGEATTGNGVTGLSNYGAGVYGSSPFSAGVHGDSSNTFGVNGSVSVPSQNFDAAYVGAAGVWGTSQSYVGVYGTSDSNVGVAGVSKNSRGIYGRSITDYAGYFDGPVYISGNIVNPSDRRLKKGVSNLGYGLPEVLRLRPVTWRWKDRPDRGLQLGLIAQEVETVLPELVATDKDAEQTKGLNYIGLVPVTIKAIQEQQELIKQQQAEFKKQRTIFASQQQQIEALKKLVCRTHSRAVVCR